MAFDIRNLSGVDLDRVRTWTFPAFRHLLELKPTVRFLELGDKRPIQPLALVATENAEPKGMIVGCLPTKTPDVVIEGPNGPEVLSLYVAPSCRHRSIGTALLGELEKCVAGARHSQVSAVYMTGRPETEYLERILQRRNWTPPELRMSILKGTLEEFQSTPWYGRYRSTGLEFFPWAELDEGALEALKESQSATGWIAADLCPWEYKTVDLDVASSIGIRYKGEIVGWILNHRLSEGVIRFTCSFVRQDLARKAKFVPALSESIRRARNAGYTRFMFAVPGHHRAMHDFACRWCAPWLSFQGETRYTSKTIESVGSVIET